MKAGDVMTTGAATIRPEASLAEAAQVMVDNEISGLPVVDARDKLVGIVTEGDFLLADRGQKPRLIELLTSGSATVGDELAAHRVEEIMTRDPATVTPETPLEEVVALMNERKVKRLPVISQGKVVGIVSRANLMLALVRKAQAGGKPRRG